MGVHLSKVRSLALDFWNPEHVELMKYIGNERSWEVFEEGFDEDSAGEVQRPNEDSSQSIKEKWIAAKYVNRQFVKLSRQPDLSSVEVEVEVEDEVITQDFSP